RNLHVATQWSIRHPRTHRGVYRRHLHASPTDLAACSLVQRSWRYAAQSHIFRDLRLSIAPNCTRPLGHLERRSTQLLELFSASNRLTRFAVRLDLDPGVLSSVTFAAVARCPFPKLRTLHMSTMRDLTLPLVAGMQNLLSTPSLHRIQLSCPYDLDMFPRIWETTAPGIRHVELNCYDADSDPVPNAPSNDTRPRIPIESLNLVAYEGITRWLVAPRCLFDFGHLKALRLCLNNIALLRVPAFSAAAATLELLDVSVDLVTGPVDLATYPRLTFIHIVCRPEEYLWMVLDTLGTIPHRNHIQEIIVYHTPIGEAGRKQIMQRLVATPLPYLRTLEVRKAHTIDDVSSRESGTW
ncbi:hypothetical protein C8R44DRAFT_199246, partial [Mycena epipterygia]